MKLLAVGAQGPTSPSFRIRLRLPAPALATHGVAIEPLPLFTDREFEAFCQAGVAGKGALALRARRALRRRLDPAVRAAEGTVVHRRVDVLPDLTLERLVRRGGRLVLDVDDAVWLESRRPGAHSLAALKGSGRKLRWLARHADQVIAGNATLADHLSDYASQVEVVPSLVDTARVKMRRHEDSEELVVGWIGSETTAPFMERIRGALGRAAAGGADRRLRLLMVGGGVTRPPPGVAYETSGWSLAAEADALARMDVGLMPQPDTAWNRGKCGYKALQYMAAGVPVLADDVGLIREVLGGEEAGYAVRGEDAWVDALDALLSSAALRQRLGEAGRARVERDFSIARWAPRLAAILRGER